MNQIVNLKCRDIKRLAKQMYKGRFMQCFAVVLGCQIIAMAPEYLAYLFIESDLVYELAGLVSFILRVVLTLASYGYCLRISRGENPSMDDIADTFQLTGQSLILEILSDIKIALRAILFIIPGILYAIKIALSRFILVDNPTMDAKTALRTSENLMRGNMNKFFKLQVSYIGIYLLCSLPKSIYSAIYGPDFSSYFANTETMSYEALMNNLNEAMDVYSKFINSPIVVALEFVGVIAITYTILCNSAFYDIAAGNIIIESHDDATNIEY